MTYLAGDARAFIAAVRRELRSMRRYPTVIVASLFWPIVLPGFYVLMGRVYSGNDPRAVAAFAARSGTADYAGFVFVGFAMYMWLSIFLWNPGTLLRQEQLRGSLEAVFLTPASRLVILFGPPVAYLWPVFFQFVVMAVALRVLFGIELSLDALARAAAVIVVGIPSMYALAAFFSTAVLRFGEIGPLVQLVRGTLVLLCGITYPVAMLPGWAQTAAAAVPTTYIVQDVRRVLLARAGIGAVVGDLGLTLAFAAVFAGLAVISYRWIERDARRRGTMGTY
ncbi:MAG: ABC transporter permease [Chloroflexota bacterium]|nr:ABC transporter permease [Chloroflexota bacterium]